MGANDAQEMLVAAKAECVRLERENAKLRADLDARFEHSDHLSAKYYRRMRDAERRGDELREQLANAQKIIADVYEHPDSAIAAAVAVERERCAQIAEDYLTSIGRTELAGMLYARIRAVPVEPKAALDASPEKGGQD